MSARCGMCAVAALENVAAPLPPEVPGLGEAPHQKSYSGGQIRIRRFQQQMEVVAHQNPSMDQPTVAAAGPSHPVEKRLVILAAFKDRLS